MALRIVARRIILLVIISLASACFKCRLSASRTSTPVLAVLPTAAKHLPYQSTKINNEVDSYHLMKERNQGNLKQILISWVKWYRTSLSPLMPPNCRFLPTCSYYSIEAIDRFGPSKGLVLTAWRILRCSPFGGSGYDPPVWPPPGFRAGSTTKPWF